MPFDIFALHEKIFFVFYSLLGPNSFVSPLTVFCAVWLPVVVVILPFIYELYKSEEFSIFKLFWKIYLTPVIVYLLTVVIKFYYHTPRPFALLEIPPAFVVSSDPYGLMSFPSSHTAVFAALATVVYLSNPKMGKWFFALALLIGLARIGAGVHWPVDILGGFLIGLVSAFLLEKAFLLFEKRGTT